MKIKKGGIYNAVKEAERENWMYLLPMIIVMIVGIIILGVLFPHPGGVPI